MMVNEPGGQFSGHAVIDETFMRERGVKDFSRYQCVPGKEPPPAWPASQLGIFRPPKSASVPPGVYSLNASSSNRSKL